MDVWGPLSKDTTTITQHQQHVCIYMYDYLTDFRHCVLRRLKEILACHFTCVSCYSFRGSQSLQSIGCQFSFTWSSFDLTLVAELCSCISFCSFCSRVLSFGFLIRKEPSQTAVGVRWLLTTQTTTTTTTTIVLFNHCLQVLLSHLCYLFRSQPTNQPKPCLLSSVCFVCCLSSQSTTLSFVVSLFVVFVDFHCCPHSSAILCCLVVHAPCRILAIKSPPGNKSCHIVATVGIRCQTPTAGAYRCQTPTAGAYYGKTTSISTKQLLHFLVIFGIVEIRHGSVQSSYSCDFRSSQQPVWLHL